MPLSHLPIKLLLCRSTIENTKTHFRKFVTTQQNAKPRSWHSLFRPEEIEAHKALYPIVIEAIAKPVSSEMPEVTEKLKTVIGRVLPNDRLIDGLKVTTLYKMLDPPEKQTEKKIFCSGILGWCADFTFSSLLIFDDIIDHAETRGGKPCLHKYKDVKWEAVNYGLLVENAPYLLLKEFCSHYPWYTPCVELLHSVVVDSSLGNTIEEMSRADGKPMFERYTKENSLVINKYKARSLGVLMPLMLAMFSSGNYDLLFPKVADEVVAEIGRFLSIQNDMADYEYSKINSSLACDISEGKCTWLIIQALEKSSTEQKEVIYEYYGQKNMKSLRIISRLYENIGIFDLYKDYKEKSYNFVREETRTLPIQEDHRRLLYNYSDLVYEMSPN